jgi:hypothetical protein
MGPLTFGIFDAFPDESGRQAHLSGQVAAELMKKASELLVQPEGLKSDVDVYLYLIDEGVKNLTNQAQHRESRRAGCQASRVMSEENNLRGFVAMTYAPR